MIVSYLDASAAMKLLIDEAESEALVSELSGNDERTLCASWLLHTELHCAAGRHPDSVDLASVQVVLDTVNLIDPIRGDFLSAGTQAPLRSNDAIHMAVAMRVGADEMITYDSELSERALRAGLTVVAPI